MCDAATCPTGGGDAQADACPNDPDKTAPGVCGCDVPDIDSDADGTLDCEDGCPEDGEKQEPGACGCGALETDADNDGAPDCEDECPNDPNKTAPLLCGCGEGEQDGDSDEVVDCLDGCPTDPEKDDPGICGCALADTLGDNSMAECLNLGSAMIHRYSFTDEATAALDSVGSASGSVQGAASYADGSIDLNGVASVGLPTDVLDSLTDVTVELWFRRGDNDVRWQRLFDFGETDGTQALSSFYLTPRASGDRGDSFLVGIRTLTTEAIELSAPMPAPLLEETHVAAVLSDSDDEMALYVNGIRVGALAWLGALSDINAVNNWLGRSQFDRDPPLFAAIDEVRIYDAALGEAQVAYSFAAGTDPIFLEPSFTPSSDAVRID